MKDPTCTALLFDELKAAKDFRSVAQLMEYTRLDKFHVMHTLYYLKKCKAADLVSDCSGTWWFATPSTDKRICQMATRKIENEPRRKNANIRIQKKYHG